MKCIVQFYGNYENPERTSRTYHDVRSIDLNDNGDLVMELESRGAIGIARGEWLAFQTEAD